MDPLDIPGGVSVTVNASWIVAVSVLYVAGIVRALRGARRERRIEIGEQDIASSSLLPLREGAKVVSGTVVTEGDEPVITLKVLQHGTEHDNDGWTYEWREQERETIARPFELRTARGEHVSVTPPKTVRLHQQLRVVPKSPFFRTQVAELRAGEHVMITGRLRAVASGDVYRQVPGPPWRLDAPEGERMLAAAIPLALRADARTNAYVALAGGLLLLLVGLHGTLASYFYAPLRSGGALVGEIVSAHPRSPRSDDDRSTCVLEFRVETHHRSLTASTERDVAVCSAAQVGDPVWVYVSNDHVTLGAEPYLSLLFPAFFIIAGILWTLMMLQRLQSLPRTHEDPMLNERGRGRLSQGR